MDARAYLLDRVPLVERALEAALPSAEEPPGLLHRAMRHLVFPAGKRLRPVLCMAAAEAVGAPPERALPFAVGVELVHTYSLVHDDLPCMDDDTERRGRPTVHVAFGEATAVLAGDALLALAFQTVCEAPAAGVTDADRLRGLAELARAAGSGALVGGQCDDLELEAGVASPEHVESIHLRKTAALIASAIAGGAVFGGATDDQVESLRYFGRGVGLAFQIADDLLDADDGDQCSLVALLGAEAAGARGEEVLESALASLGGFGERAEPLRALALFALRRKE